MHFHLPIGHFSWISLLDFAPATTAALCIQATSLVLMLLYIEHLTYSYNKQTVGH